MTEPTVPLGDALRESLPTYEAPESLHAWARAQASATAPASRARVSRRVRPFLYAAALVFAGVIGSVSERYLLEVKTANLQQNELIAMLVDTHVRSLMANHLTDVQSTDQHTVKPWFAGKVNFSPHVPELSAQGFPLVGGRVEYVRGHEAAALVYGRRLHTINLFVWPESTPEEAQRTAAYNGYSLVHWTDHGLSYWAISDVAPADLKAFEDAFVSSH